MPFFHTTVKSPPKSFFTLAALISFLLILSHGFITATKAQNYTYGGDPAHNYTYGGDPFGTCAAWQIPTQEMKMRIGIPGKAQFQEFVKVNPSETSDEKKFDGFCIELFREVLKIFSEKNYTLPYEFVPYKGTYNELVEGVSNGTFDAAVGDITILADRISKDVEFTQSYMESRLVMIAPALSQHKAWQFLKPFTVNLWIATGVILIYTMFIVWFLERRTNEEMGKIGTAVWFTFSSLFFSQREKIKNNFTRVVVVVWLFVVLVINSSYTASLTSMLTVSHLQPKVASIEWLKKSNSKIGCDGDSFMLNYLKEVLEFTPDNIKTVGTANEYIEEFESGSIAAAFLELPYGKYFISQHSEGYVMTEPKYKRFGGFGFVFKKCSPIANNVSEAILTLFENERLNMLESKWFGRSFDYSKETTKKVESLSLQSFWGLYLITVVTSTVLFIIQLLMNYCCKCSESEEVALAPLEARSP